MSCKAQSPVVNIDASWSATPDGAYFKDLNNEFDKFIGTWIYTDGGNTLTIELKKVEMIFNGTDYEDKLVGEYKYTVNDFTLVNTLSNINNNNPAKHKIKGNFIVNPNQEMICNDCSPDERRVSLTFYDSERKYLYSSIILRYIPGQTNPEQMQVTIYSRSGGLLPSDDAPQQPRVPYGTYLMEKQ